MRAVGQSGDEGWVGQFGDLPGSLVGIVVWVFRPLFGSRHRKKAALF